MPSSLRDSSSINFSARASCLYFINIHLFYYIQKHSDTNSKLELIKYLFFADRIHARKHFSFISVDNYFALKYGPVASSSLYVLNKHKEYLDNFPESELKHIDNIKKINNSTRIIDKVSDDLLSKNEMSSIDKSINLFSGKKLVEISHDYPEWKRYKELFDKRLISKEPIVIGDFFCNPDIDDSPAIKKYFGATDPLYENEDYLMEAKEFFLQSSGQYA
jgi:uncharacterized phage-associated protein